MHALDRALVFVLTPIWLLAFALSLRSLDRNEVVAPFRATGAPSASGYPHVSRIPEWTVRPAREEDGLRIGDALVEIGGVDARGASAARAIALAWDAMDESGALALAIERDGERRPIVARIPGTIPKWPVLVVSFVFAATALVSVLRFPHLEVARKGFPALMGSALWTGSYFGTTPTEWLAAFGVRVFALLFLQAAAARALRHFPDGVDRVPWARGWPVVFGLNGVLLYDGTMLGAMPGLVASYAGKAIAVAGALLFAAICAYRYRIANRSDRRRFKWLFLGVLVAVTPGAAVAFASAVRPELGRWFLPSQLAQVALPVALAIGVVRHRLFDIDRLLNATLAAFAGAALLGAAALFLGPSALRALEALGVSAVPARLALVIAASALAAPAALALRRRLDAFVERARSERAARIDAVLGAVARAGKLREVAEIAAAGTASALESRGALVMVEVDGALACEVAVGDAPPAELAAARSGGRESIDDDGRLVAPFEASSDGRVVRGALALAPRRSGEPFEPGDAQLAARVAERVAGTIRSLEERALLSRSRARIASLREQRERALRDSEEKSRLLAAASHDARQPLQALRLFLGSLESGIADAQQREIASKAQLAALSLQQSLDALLDEARLASGVLAPRVETVSLASAFAELDATFAPLAHAKGLALEIEPTDAFVESDPALLRSILQNLVGNAVRYTDAGSVRVAAHASTDARVEIEVSDTGRGIAGDELRDVFTAWSRGESARGDATGLGLGLSIVARLAAALEHDIEVDSATGGGTRFRVLAARALPRESAAHAPVGARAATDGGRPLVLVVDDDAAAREALSALLARWSYEVAAAATAGELVAACAGRAPAAVLLDHRLDSGTGFDALAELEAAFGPLPAALVSADEDPAVAARAAERRLLFLRKPAPPVQVRAVIASLLREG